jgi:2-polyprenyl-3-methyl-5-hydroxy-6-metoxy-1,4-benzoquinol methylase
MDRADLERADVRAVAGELDELVTWLRRHEIAVSSWYGKFDLRRDRYQVVNRGFDYAALPGAADDLHWPWFLYWEIGWLVVNNDFQQGQELLDLGGSSSLFSFLLASRGIDVTTVDIRPELVENAERVARKTGWSLRNLRMDMRKLQIDRRFDHATSVCVYEHLPVSGRLDVSRRVRDMLHDGGTFSVTFDYGNPSAAARLSSPDDVEAQFVTPSGLSVRGNREFHDNGLRYLANPFFRREGWWRGWKGLGVLRREFRLRDLPRTKDWNDYTFGALFLERGAR